MKVSMKRVISEGQFGDARRNQRMFNLVHWLTKSFVSGAAAGSPGVAWAMSMAAWRFFNNGSVALSAAYDVVRSAIREVLAQSTQCFVVHDVSVLDFSGHDAKSDRVLIGDHRGLGYEVYSALVLDPRGNAIGPVFQEIRAAGGAHSSEVLTKREAKRGIAKFVGHIEQMEKAVAAIASHLVGKRIVHIGDREFEDIKAMRLWMKTHAEFIVRVQHLNRRVLFGDVHMSLATACEDVRLRRQGTIEKDGVRYRRWLGEIEVTLDGFSRRGRHRGETPKKGDPIALRCIIVELRSPDRETIRWVLFTNTAESIDWIVQAYVWRWRVERYFYLIKVGFKLTDWTQQTAEAIARKLAVTSLAAMIVYKLLDPEHDDPDRESAIRTLASMGGWLGRKRDPIGPLVLLRGVTTLLNAATLVEEIGADRVRELAEELVHGPPE